MFKELHFFIRNVFILCLSLYVLIKPISLGAESISEIDVELETESVLSPIYISNFYSLDDTVSSRYLSELRSVLDYDLAYSGYLRVLPQTAEKEKLIQTFSKDKATNLTHLGGKYIIKSQVSEQSLNVTLIDVCSSKFFSFDRIDLKKSIQQDRVRIHKLADQIVATLFNASPFAHSSLIYCVQTKDAKNSSKSVSEIWTCDWDGRNKKQLTDSKNYLVTPLFFSKNHKASPLFLFVSYEFGSSKICLRSLNETRSRRLIDLKGNQMLPCLSKDGSLLAFICDASGRTDLFVQKIDSEGLLKQKPVQLFSYPHSTQASPTFSPDGQQVAFVSDKDGSPRVYVIPVSFDQLRPVPRLISKKNRESSCPSWSPDGTKLAYSAKKDSIRQIWIYDFLLDKEIQLTYGKGNKENPVWGPDSFHIAFNSTDPNSSELYVINLNQPDPIKITDGEGKKHYPKWGMK
ncbi:MAG: translocation protein TolB [Rhabdochlamydiaceae bacterium]